VFAITQELEVMLQLSEDALAQHAQPQTPPKNHDAE
jgi:hypothetical protein